jgi:hypothetical protein
MSSPPASSLEALPEVAPRERQIRGHLVELAVGVEEEGDGGQVAFLGGSCHYLAHGAHFSRIVVML